MLEQAFLTAAPALRAPRVEACATPMLSAGLRAAADFEVNTCAVTGTGLLVRASFRVALSIPARPIPARWGRGSIRNTRRFLRQASMQAPLDARRLHVEKGFSSLFSYCVEELRFSEDEACRRIEAARLARRFPAIHPLLETAAVSLTVLGLLKPHLTDENHREMLAGVCGSSVRQAKEWLAAQFPQPDVPSTIRKQVARFPVRVMPPLVGARVPTGTENVLNGVEPSLRRALPASTRAIPIEPSSQDRFCAAPAAPTRAIPVEPSSQDRFVAAPPAATRARVEPLSQDPFPRKVHRQPRPEREARAGL
jgi:hypothetical protein